MKRLIVITGFSGHGKDYVSNLFKKEFNRYGLSVKIIKTGTKLRGVLADLFDEDVNHFEKYKDCKYISDLDKLYEKVANGGISLNRPTYRDMMKDFATVARKYNNDIFIHHVIKDMATAKEDILILNDLRYLSDYQLLKSRFNIITDWFHVEKIDKLPKIFNWYDKLESGWLKDWGYRLIQLLYPEYRHPEECNFLFREVFTYLNNNSNINHNVDYYVSRILDNLG